MKQKIRPTVRRLKCGLFICPANFKSPWSVLGWDDKFTFWKENITRSQLKQEIRNVKIREDKRKREEKERKKGLL